MAFSLTALYDKVNRTEPAILRALAQGSAKRLAPTMAELGGEASLEGWQLRVLDGNHLPASEKRLGPLRGYRGAALPGHTLVVHDPDSGLVCDIAPREDAHKSERTVVPMLMDMAGPGQVWIADRHFCTHHHAGIQPDGGCVHRTRTRQPSPAGGRRPMVRMVGH